MDIFRSGFSRKISFRRKIETQHEELVGCLLYLRLTRPDLHHSLQLFSHYSRAPASAANSALNHCLGYIILTVDNGDDLTLVAFADTTWATNRKNRKSLGGMVIYLGPSIICAASKEHRYLDTSSAAG